MADNERLSEHPHIAVELRPKDAEHDEVVAYVHAKPGEALAMVPFLRQLLDNIEEGIAADAL